jgi:hypothetical protein
MLRVAAKMDRAGFRAIDFVVEPWRSPCVTAQLARGASFDARVAMPRTPLRSYHRLRLSRGEAGRVQRLVRAATLKTAVIM